MSFWDSSASHIPGLMQTTLNVVKEFIASPSNFNVWQPDGSKWDVSSISRINALRLPRTIDNDESSYPDLLLYALGHLEDIDPSYASRLAAFTSGNDHLLLVNTSGSGKTRLVLETLHRHWGLFFSAGTNMINRYGSNDLRDAIIMFERSHDTVTLDIALTGRRSGQFSEPLNMNRETFLEIFSRVILSRLFLLDFVYTTGTELGMSEAEIRTKWLWLQLRPTACVLLDIFGTCLNGIRSWSQLEVQTRTAELLARHKDRIAFVAFDEAQAFNETLKGAFASFNCQLHRPVLREIIFCTASILPSARVVVSGTRVDDGLMEDAISASASDAHSVRLFNALGSFSEENAPAYIAHFLGTDLSMEPKVKWFFGRRRFIRVLVGYILVHGLKVASRIIDSIIYATTDVIVDKSQPRMSIDLGLIVTNQWLDGAPSTISFDSHSLWIGSALAPSLRKAAYSAITHGKPAVFLGHARAAVGSGVARFVDDSIVSQLDEILILLNLIRWVSTSRQWSTRAIIQRRIDNPAVSTRDMGLPEALSLYLWRRWAASGIKIASIASFMDATPSWAKCSAEFLLTSVRDGARNFSVVKSLEGPLIHAASSFKDVADWFQNSHSPFLIPDDDMGPQIVFILDALDGPQLVFVHVEPFESDRERRHDEVVPQDPHNFYSKARVHRKAFHTILASFLSKDSSQRRVRSRSFNMLQIFCFAEVRASDTKRRSPAAEMLLTHITGEIGKYDFSPLVVIKGL